MTLLEVFGWSLLTFGSFLIVSVYVYDHIRWSPYCSGKVTIDGLPHWFKKK